MSGTHLSRVVRPAFPWLVVLGILIAALNMRGPIVAPTPVMSSMKADLGLNGGAGGLITTAPVLMFALATPFALWVIRRRGAEAALMATLVGVLVGTLIRGLGGYGWLLVGMFVIGASITIGNVVVPVIIRRDVPPGRIPLVTASYTAALNLGSLITALATAPLARLIGWNLAIMSWALFAVVGIIVWGSAMRTLKRRRAVLEEEPARDDVAVLTGPIPVTTGPVAIRSRMVTLLAPVLMIGFGMQSASYYSLTTWFPSIAADSVGLTPEAAGGVAALFQGLAIIGAFLVPVLMRVAPLSVAALVMGVGWVTTALGLALAPQLLVLWACVGAVAQAGAFTVVFAMLATAARTDREAASMSAIVQGGGYLLAASAPPILGMVHDASGGWAAPAWVLVVCTSIYLLMMMAAVLITRRHR